MRTQAEAVAADLIKGNILTDPGKRSLAQTRREVEQGWRALESILLSEGEKPLATQVRRFVDDMLPVRTEKEQLAAKLLEHDHGSGERDRHPFL